MKLEANLTESINYAKLLFNDIGQLVLLIVFGIIPIVNFVFLGYLGNILKGSKNSKQLPSFDNYGELWNQGLKIAIVSLIYMIIPLVFIIPFFDFWGVFSFLTFVRGNAATLLLLVGVMLAFFLASILSMGLINMLKHNDLSKAFAFGEILDYIKTIGWGNYAMWLMAIFVCLVIVSAIGRVFNILFFLAFLIAPVFGVFVARSAALIYCEGTPTNEPATAIDQNQQ